MIQENFDFDGDKKIEPKEFLDAFVLMCWTKPHRDGRKVNCIVDVDFYFACSPNNYLIIFMKSLFLALSEMSSLNG